ncbi:MAG: hypothetical protein IPQ03_11695 [Bacteroidetes bacterium]|nr:hypothetical protein [Bacteroidota bacterium]
MKSTLNFPTFPTLLLAFAFIILLLITPGRNFAQTLFNGSFETNTAGANLINLSNPAFSILQYQIHSPLVHSAIWM